jgi:hypothetical protein
MTLVSAQFSDDGTRLALTLSAPYSGGRGNTFNCASIFVFFGAASSTCQWTGADGTSVDAEGGLLVLLGSPVSLVSPSAANVVYVMAPSNPIVPSVSIRAADAFFLLAADTSGTNSSCQLDYLFDCSASSGNGGRAWTLNNQTSVAVTMRISGKHGTPQALALFLANNYSLATPTYIPASLLSAGTSYTFVVTLCNFLGACSVASKTVLVMSTKVVPIGVSILGPSIVSLSSPNKTLSLMAEAVLPPCLSVEEAAAFRGYSWAWVDRKTGLTVKSLVSTSSDPSIFSLDAFTLAAGTIYSVSVSVLGSSNSTSTSTATASSSSSSSTIVTVQEGVVVAAIQGSSTQFVGVGSILTLKAVAKDSGNPRASLSFSWTCVGVFPTTQCGVSLPSKISQRLQASLTVGGGVQGSTSLLTVLVSPGNVAASVLVVVVTSTVPTVLVSASTQQRGILNSGDVVNPFEQVRLMASISPGSGSGSAFWEGATAWWSSPLMSSTRLAASSLTPIVANFSSTFPSAVYLALSPYTLPAGSTVSFALTFRLTSGAGSATNSMSIRVNAPPAPGSFTSAPKTGTQLQTIFTLSALLWTDPDLPLTYSFGFYDAAANDKLTVRDRSQASTATTLLPAGHAVRLFLDVFDSYEANTTASCIVSVVSALGNGGAFDRVLGLVGGGFNLSSSSSSSSAAAKMTRKALSQLLQTSSIASAVVNAVNCTTPVVCSTLNRSACSATVNTCGSCLGSSYFGEPGDANSPCVASSAALAVVTAMARNVTCSCSGRGTCIFYSASSSPSSRPVRSCSIGASREGKCRKKCSCFAGYTGSHCETSTADKAAKTALRTALVGMASVAAQAGATSPSVVVATANMLSRVSSAQPAEMSTASFASSLVVAKGLFSSAASTGVSHNDVRVLLSCVNVSTGADAGSGRRRLQSSSTLQEQLKMLQQYALLTFQDGMVPGQSDVVEVLTLYRLAVGPPASLRCGSPSFISFS